MADELARALLHYTDRNPGIRLIKTPIGEVGILRSDHPKPPTHMIMKPSMCIVAQGAKWATFGGNRLEYKAGEALVVGVATPSVGRVVAASPEEPCLVLAFELDRAIMRGVAEEMAPAPIASGESGSGVFVANFEGPLSECALRLVRLLDRPEAVPTLYPLMMREICYWLLRGPQGGEVMRMCLANSPSHRLINAAHCLRERFAEPVQLAELAAVAQLSLSAFHRQFKALTSLTPLQYQKQLRLLEARRLMISEALNVETAAFAVGYESPSQFSREYSRMFGSPPKRDSGRLKAGFADAFPVRAQKLPA